MPPRQRPCPGSYSWGDDTGGGCKMELISQTEITCPHCGEVFPIQVDTSQSEQTLIEDCAVCCRPITLAIHCRPGEVVDLATRG
jgi:hypothetical protein